ncbi:MAG TPA: hypothetical protein VLK25_06545 [Allosphingosinicella sp.]|nr:hypothetical protein [Allosphingosinicella sp.]
MLFLSVLLVASQPLPPADGAGLGRTAWIVATVGHSEWCPAGNVRLDLSTGRYRFTAGVRRPACTDESLERPVRVGTLGAGPLATIRAAFLRVLDEDVMDSACRDGSPQDHVVISNGGTPVLVLTTGALTVSTPDDLTCWSPAANALHDTLERTFPGNPR